MESIPNSRSGIIFLNRFQNRLWNWFRNRLWNWFRNRLWNWFRNRNQLRNRKWLRNQNWLQNGVGFSISIGTAVWVQWWLVLVATKNQNLHVNEFSWRSPNFWSQSWFRCRSKLRFPCRCFRYRSRLQNRLSIGIGSEIVSEHRIGIG